MEPKRDSPEVLARFHANLDLVEAIAHQVGREVGRLVEFEDLRAMGHKGLLEAARRFDEGRGVPFRRYANYRVRGSMLDGVRACSHRSRRLHSRLNALEAALRLSEAAAEEAGSPGAAAVAADPAAADARLAEQLAEIGTAMAVAMLRPTGIGEEGERIAVDSEESPEDAAAQGELFRAVVAALAGLPDDERTLLEQHYLHGERFDRVAATLGLSKSWASRLHKRAIARLTKRLHALAT